MPGRFDPAKRVRTWENKTMPANLFEEHRLILSTAEAFLAALRRGPDPADAIHGLRAQLAGKIRRHRAREDALVLAPFAAAGGFAHLPEVSAQVQRIQQEWLGYSRHVGRWTRQAMAANWDGYVSAVAERVDMLRRLTAVEEREVYGPILRFLAAREAALPQPMPEPCRATVA